jgi:hypothetical protein
LANYPTESYLIPLHLWSNDIVQPQRIQDVSFDQAHGMESAAAPRFTSASVYAPTAPAAPDSTSASVPGHAPCTRLQAVRPKSTLMVLFIMKILLFLRNLVIYLLLCPVLTGKQPWIWNILHWFTTILGIWSLYSSSRNLIDCK